MVINPTASSHSHLLPLIGGVNALHVGGVQLLQLKPRCASKTPATL